MGIQEQITGLQDDIKIWQGEIKAFGAPDPTSRMVVTESGVNREVLILTRIVELNERILAHRALIDGLKAGPR